MPRRMTIAPHLSAEELHARFRHAKTPTVAHHYQIMWLLACGKTTAEVMAVTGYSRGWIYELVWGYNHLGPESLEDRRCQNSDRDPLLNDLQQALLWQVPKQPPRDGGLWNGRKVADWMSELLGEKVCRQRGWEYLKSMKFRLRVPRPSHQESALLEQEEWKKKSTPSSQENPEKIPFKRRRSLVNGRTPSGIKTDFKTRVGGRV